MSDERRHYDAKLGDLLVTVGRLEAQMEEGARQRSAMFRMIGEVRDGMVEVKGLAKTVQRHDEEIEKFKALKWKLAGGALVIGAGGASAVWATIKSWLHLPPGGP